MSEIYRGDDSDIVGLMRENATLEARLTQAQARIAELETALDPFAKFAEAFDGESNYRDSSGFIHPLGLRHKNISDDNIMMWARRGCIEPEVLVTLGHFRAAQTARRGKAEMERGK